jgi:hypothetical protein
VLSKERDFRSVSMNVGPLPDSPETLAYRQQLNSEGSPSELVTTEYQYTPGTEVERLATAEIH